MNGWTKTDRIMDVEVGPVSCTYNGGSARAILTKSEGSLIAWNLIWCTYTYIFAYMVFHEQFYWMWYFNRYPECLQYAFLVCCCSTSIAGITESLSDYDGYYFTYVSCAFSWNFNRSVGII